MPSTGSRRTARAVVTAAVAAGVLGSSGVAAAETMSTCYAIAGTVRDRAGRALDGATASVSSACYGPRSVVTGADGRYQLFVTGGSVNATADVSVVKTGYNATTQRVTATPKVGSVPVRELTATDIMWSSASTSSASTTSTATPEKSVATPGTQLYYRQADLEYQNSDFSLTLWPSASIATAATRAPGTVGVSIRVAAPPPSHPGTTARVVAHRTSNGAALTLTPAYGTDGWTTWTGAVDVAAGEPDRADAVRFCAVVPAHEGTCATATTAVLLSNVSDLSFKVDSTPPVLTGATPGPYRTATTLSTLTTTWSDALAGLSGGAAGFQVWIDGVPRSTSVSGGTTYTSMHGLAPGVHSVQVRATDAAGNVAWRTYVFSRAAVTATDATATLVRRSTRVNPNGSVPPPGSLTFAAPTVQLSSFDETFSASTYVGKGTIRRAFALGTVEVEFVNETGIPHVAAVAVPTSTASHEVAFLTPSSTALRAHIAAATTTIGSITVTVPPGYGTPGSTATLRAKSVALGAPVTAASELNPTRLGSRMTLVGQLEGCFAGDEASRQAYCQTGDRAEVRLTSGTAVATKVYPAPDADPERGFAPYCDGCASPLAEEYAETRTVFGCVEHDTAVVLVDPASLQPTNVTVDLCDANVRNRSAAPGDGIAAAYLNAWMFAAPEALFPVWHQSHVDAPSEGSRCPNGESGLASGRVYRVAANVVGFDGAEEPEHDGVRDPVDEVGTEPAPQRVVLGDGSRGYSVTHDDALVVTPLPAGVGRYHLAPSAWVDALGQPHGELGSTSNLWEHGDAITAPAGEGVSGRVSLVTGTTFLRPGTAGAVARVASLHFQVVVDLSGCQAAAL